ncbi:hypothetical protein WJX81_003947 [Elliptochloris bilobata]|uniref:Uncharacterized protein n=1 Tax=Elliptochloris bilobata TaxID=381761 RepID=A0AAW1R0C4_9CHLO
MTLQPASKVLAPQPARPAAAQAEPRIYQQIIAHAAGNGVALALGAILLGLWRLLADVREPALWAAVCSVVLRDLKQALVSSGVDLLQGRSLPMLCATLALAPLRLLSDPGVEAVRACTAWCEHMAEMAATSQVHEPAHPVLRWMRRAGHASGRVLGAAWRRSRARSPSAALFVWLLRAVALQELAAGTHAAVRAAPQACLAVLCTVLADPELEGVPAQAINKEPETAAGKEALHTSPALAFAQPAAAPQAGLPHAMQRLAAATGPMVSAARTGLEFAAGLLRPLAGADARVRAWLREALPALVTGGLIVAVLVGPLLASLFLAVQVGREGRTAVLDVREALPANWSANSTLGLGRGLARGWLGSAWAANLQQRGVAIMRQQVPTALGVAEAQLTRLAEQHNLTAVLADLRLLYASFQAPANCTNGERQAHAVARAKAGARLHAAQAAAAGQEANVMQQERALEAALPGGSADDSSSDAGGGPAAAGGAVSERESAGSSACRAVAPLPAWAEEHPLRAAEEAVAAADAALTAARSGLVDASAAVEAAREETALADRAAQTCRPADGSAEAAAAPERESSAAAAARAAAEHLGGQLARLWAAVAALDARRAWEQARTIGTDAAASVRDALSGPGGGARDAELSVLQRLVRSSLGPLQQVGQALGNAAVRGLGGAGSLALAGGGAAFRAGAGAITFSLQFLVFVGLLYFLLELEQDPLALLVGFAPGLSEAARRETHAALGNALRGVFLTPLKTTAARALCTWLALRAARVHLLWTCTLAAAIFTLVPLAPTWLFGLPASVELFARGQLWAALAVPAVLFASTWADDLILCETNTNSYLFGLGLAGGLTTFDNPVKGVLFGPLMISGLSALYQLHVRHSAAKLDVRTSPGGVGAAA